MTLARRMWMTGAVLIGAVGLIAAAGLWVTWGLSRDLDVALAQYGRLRSVYEVGINLVSARAALRSEPADHLRGEAELKAAAAKLTGLVEGTGPWRAGDGPAANAPNADPSPLATDGATRSMHEVGQAALAELRSVLHAGQPESLVARRLEAINTTLGFVAAVGGHARRQIEAAELSARARRQQGAWAIGVVAVGSLAAAAGLIASQYRHVIGPLDRLRAAVAEVAAGTLSRRVPTTGDREFAELAEDFNRMAEALDASHRDLEQRVRRASHQLARSERLASVGYLAAGVAHEINNPLGIIAGHAELATKLLDRLPDRSPQQGGGGDGVTSKGAAAPGAPAPVSMPAQTLDELRESLQVVADEAFRGKAITGKLLTLARADRQVRTPVSLVSVAEEVVTMVRGVAEARERTVAVSSAGGDPLSVVASPDELKQAVLNLVVNALEATEPGTGRVTLELGEQGGEAVLVVRDNGRGLDPETLTRVFEPFFTARPAGQRGVGLGLSITHAIIEDHHGHIEAHSEGPGQGSVFTLRLPLDRSTAGGGLG